VQLQTLQTRARVSVPIPHTSILCSNREIASKKHKKQHNNKQAGKKSRQNYNIMKETAKKQQK
jgi:hypothetical protein